MARRTTIKKKIVAALLGLLVIASGTALAEEGKEALARRYLAAVPVSAAVEQTLGTILDPSQSGRAQEKIRALLKSVDLLPIQIELEKALVRNFTVEELQAAVSFYASPEGQSILAKMPAVTREIGPVMQRELFKALAANRALLEEE